MVGYELPRKQRTLLSSILTPRPFLAYSLVLNEHNEKEGSTDHVRTLWRAAVLDEKTASPRVRASPHLFLTRTGSLGYMGWGHLQTAQKFTMMPALPSGIEATCPLWAVPELPGGLFFLAQFQWKTKDTNAINRCCWDALCWGFCQEVPGLRTLSPVTHQYFHPE